jgi:hypothetical protein
VAASRSVLQPRDHRTSFRRILSVLKRRERNQSNRTQHGLSRLTTISDAGSTPAASTILRPLREGPGSACQPVAQFIHPGIAATRPSRGFCRLEYGRLDVIAGHPGRRKSRSKADWSSLLTLGWSNSFANFHQPWCDFHAGGQKSCERGLTRQFSELCFLHPFHTQTEKT